MAMSSSMAIEGERSSVLDTSETLLLQGRFEEALKACVPLLPEHDRDVEGKTADSVEEGAVAVALQSLAEMNRFEHVQKLLTSCYGSTGANMPHSICMLWLNLCEWHGDHSRLCRSASEYLKANQSRSRIDEYAQVMEVLILRGLVPLGRYMYASRVLANDALLSSQHKHAISQRLSALVQPSAAPRRPSSVDNVNNSSPSPESPALASVISHSASAKVTSMASAPNATCKRDHVKSKDKGTPQTRVFRSMAPMLGLAVLVSGGAASTWIVVWLVRRLIAFTQRRGLASLVSLWKRFIAIVFGARDALSSFPPRF